MTNNDIIEDGKSSNVMDIYMISSESKAENCVNRTDEKFDRNEQLRSSDPNTRPQSSIIDKVTKSALLRKATQQEANRVKLFGVNQMNRSPINQGINGSADPSEGSLAPPPPQ